MKTFGVKGAFSLTVLTAVLSPVHTTHVDFRSHRLTEKILLQRSSPAYFALEDVRTKHFYADEQSAAWAYEPLLTEPPKLIQAQDERRLKGLTIASINKIDVQNTELKSVEQLAEKVDHLAELIQQANSDVEPITMQQMGEILVAEELERREKEKKQVRSDTRTVSTENGHEIIVSKPVRIITKVTLPVIPQGGAADNSSNSSKVKNEPARHNIRLPDTQPDVAKYTISGPVSLRQGAAIMGGGEMLSAVQVVDGLVYAEGAINTHEAFYRIDVDKLEGEIIAEARNRDGHVIASGRVNLMDLYTKFRGTAKIKDVPLELKPAFSGSKTSIVSAASYGGKAFQIANARLQITGLEREVVRNKESGYFEDKGISSPSTYLLRAQQENFWPSIALSRSGEEEQMRLFPKALVEALLSLSLDKYQAREAVEKGIIWGRVTADGRPVEGVSVRLVGEEKKEPVYFSGFIADKNRKTTSSRGEFAFTSLEQSEGLLQLQMANQNYWPVLVPIEKKHVTYADLSIDSKRTVEFKSYDAFTKKGIGTALQPVGTDFALYVPETGVTRIELSAVNGMTLLETVQDESSPYVPTRATLNAHQIEVHIPQIEKKWLDNIKLTQNVATNSSSTITTGFVNGDEFELIVGAGSLEGIAKIVYFDDRGQVTSRGVAGGGFIVFNLPRGMQSLTIIPERSKQVVTHVVYADELAVDVSRINLTL